MSNQLEYLPFMIGDQANCVWDYDLAETNRRFLEGIDPAYFRHLVSVHEPLLETDSRQYAATALRAAYTHSLETLFALLSGFIKAPSAIAAWMIRYQNRDLEGVVTELIEAGRVQELIRKDHPVWLKASTEIFSNASWDNSEETTKQFANLFGRLAHDYVDSKQQAEYNSIKHGLRVQMGGFSLAIGQEETPGTPAPPENMRLIGSSEFGNSLYEKEELVKHNFRLKKRSVNWNPKKYIYGLSLISMSIDNVVSALRIVNGENPKNVSFHRPTDPELFAEMWKYRPSISSFDMNSIIKKEMIKPLSKEEIIALVQNPAQAK